MKDSDACRAPERRAWQNRLVQPARERLARRVPERRVRQNRLVQLARERLARRVPERRVRQSRRAQEGLGLHAHQSLYAQRAQAAQCDLWIL
jgi:hypothetical protein